MNRTTAIKFIRYLGVIALPALLSSMLLYGQDDPNEDDVFELSPFLVDASQDEGYGATETLAGTRLKTNLRDLGASISLFTEEMMNDIAATNLQELLPYVGNAEVGGMFGNFTSERSVNMFGQGTPTTLARQRPQGATRVRGLSSADLTRNYNLTDVPLDGYIIDRMAVQRGANAMLFGLGSPAGLINGQLIQPRFADTNKIELRTDDYGTIRAVLDVNRVLQDDKLAVRIAALYEDQEFAQEPTFEEDRRIFAAITYKPFENTTIKANVEAGEITSSRPDTVSPINGISEQWFNLGMPLATAEIYATGDQVWPLGNGPFLGNAGSGIMNVWPGTGVTEPNTQFGGVGQKRRRTASVIDDLANDPVGQWRFLASPTYRGQNLSGGSARNDPAGIHERSQEQGFLDLNNFNFEKIKLMAAELVNEDFSAYDVTLEQLFLRESVNQNAGIELTYHKENYDDQLFDGQWDGISSGIWIDVNPYLADGSPNPNMGRPFTFNVNPQEQLDLFRQETLRAIGFYEVDFASGDSANWLGKHTITALISEQDSYSYHHEAPFNLSPATRNADEARAFVQNVGHIGSFNPHPANLSYIGPSVLGASSYDQIRITGHSNSTISQEGDTYTFRIWDQDTQQFRDVAGNVIGPGRPRKANVSLNEVQSLATILHSHWLGGNLVTTLGWREDEVDLNAYITQRDEFNLVAIGSTDTLTPVGTQKEDIFSFGAVFHWPENWIALPEGMDLSFHYSDSENFAPEAGRTDAAGLPLAAPGGETKEYGFSVAFLDRKVNLKLNWYETALTNASVNTAIGNNEAIGEQMLFSIASSYLGAAEEQDILGNVSLSNDMVGIAEQFINIAPSSLADVYGFSRTGPFSINFSDPANSNQTADVASEGFELELFAQPSEGWNVGFNLSRQDVKQTNVARRFVALFEQLTPQWQPLFDLPANGGAYADFILNGITGFTTLKDRWDERASLIEQVRRSEGLSNDEIREWRWNLFTNYQFADDSKFSGWGIGGALRWQDDVVIGYQSDVFTNALGESIRTADLNQPIMGPSTLQGDVWFSYRPKLFENVDWKLQLNIRNALRDETLIPIKGQPDSPYTDIAQVRVTQPETFILSSIFEF